jgi:3-isopropylmalate/(R)-2-methylmalate dehydratase small subunit
VERLETFVSPATPLLLRDVDTDVIIPMRRLVALRSGDDLVRFAFEPLRYGPEGAEGPLDPDCPLNSPRYAGARILLAGANFGCGSSREPAVWAVKALGYRCVVAPSFGDIFAKNCFQNSVLPISLPEETIAALAEEARAEGATFRVDLRASTLTTPGGREIRFGLNPARREQLLEGLDEISLTLRHQDRIAAFEDQDRSRRPWVWQPIRVGEG